MVIECNVLNQNINAEIQCNHHTKTMLAGSQRLLSVWTELAFYLIMHIVINEGIFVHQSLKFLSKQRWCWSCSRITVEGFEVLVTVQDKVKGRHSKLQVQSSVTNSVRLNKGYGRNLSN